MSHERVQLESDDEATAKRTETEKRERIILPSDETSATRTNVKKQEDPRGSGYGALDKLKREKG